MVKGNESQFEPDYAVPLGDILLEYVENSGMNQAELADRMGITPKTVNQIIKGKTPITPETALSLEIIFGRPAHFWHNLERHFQQDRARISKGGLLKYSSVKGSEI